ncbi:hypothetical protein ABEF93_002723 [Exophiala dermatitidis]
MLNARRLANHAQNEEEQHQHQQYELSRLSSRGSVPAERTSRLPDTNVPKKRTAAVRSTIWKSLPVPSLAIFDDIPLSHARDHLANERVFLAYIRTSATIANLAVVILQLYRLKHNPPPHGKLSDYAMGVPVAAASLVIAIIVAIVGAWRFFVCQNVMAKSRIVGSWGVVVVLTALTASLLGTVFVLAIIVDPEI